MSKKISLKTFEGILKEVDKASIDKNRAISDIEDRDVKKLIISCSDHSKKYGISELGLAAEIGFASGLNAAGALGGVAGGMAVGGAAAGGGASIMGVVGGGAAAVEGAAGGAAAGAPVPIIGPIIGAGVGLLVGAAAGALLMSKQKQKKERLYQEAISKQNTMIRALTNEVHSLQSQYNMKDNQIKRLEYLLGVLEAYIEAKNVLAA